MAVIRKHSNKILAFSLALSAGLFWFSLIDNSRASQVTSRADTLNNAGISATSNHTIAFTVQNSLVSQACSFPPCSGTTSSTLSVTFPAGFNLANLTCGDVNIATGSAFLLNVASPEVRTTCLNTGTSWGILIDSANRVITLTSPTSSTQYVPVSTGTQLTISIGSNATFQNQGTHWITNPSSAGSQTISVGGTFGGTGNMEVAIKQALQLSATVAETLTFTISSVAAGSCTADDGATITAISTAATSVPFGTLSPNTFYQGCQDLTISTNAGYGYSLTDQENSALQTVGGGLIIPDTTCDAGNCSVATATTWVTPTNYGLGHTCTNQSGSDCNPTYGNGKEFKPLSDTAAGNNGATIRWVQDNGIAGQTTVTTSASFASNNTAGDLIVVAVDFSSNRTVVQVKDTAGNTYIRAVQGANDGLHYSNEIWYAKNIVGGANTVKLGLDAAPGTADLYIHEYSGLDTVSPLDVTASSMGTSATPTSGPATTNFANELIFGFGTTADAVSMGAGSTFIQRQINDQESFTEDNTVSAIGSYTATSTASGSTHWTMAMATFKATTGVGQTFMSSTGTVTNSTGRVKYRLSVGAGQPAGTYTNLVTFIATPIY